MTNQQLATTFTEALALEQPPVALAFVEERPNDVPDASAPAPSACTFWRRGQTELFYAAAADHYECPVGAMTMGFELPPERASEAQQLVGTMIELDYFSADEVAHLPGVQKPHRGIVYGPRPYVLVVLVRGIQDEKVSKALIAEISRVVWEAAGR